MCFLGFADAGRQIVKGDNCHALMDKLISVERKICDDTTGNLVR